MTPGPRFIARALVSLGQPTIDRAWAYHTGWNALDVARVPWKLRREVLDRRLIEAETHAMTEVARWRDRNATAPLLLIGGMGIGKSFAAATWLLHCARAGRSIAWVSAAYLASLPLERDRKREQDRDMPVFGDEERRALEADALVLDDIGAGTLNKLIIKRINGLFLERDASERETLACLNAAAEDGQAWIAANFDPRLIDRQRSGGGDIVYLRETTSMRKPKDDPEVCKKTGRGRAWKFAARLLALVGVVDDFDGETWHPESKRQIIRPTFGGQLEATLVHSPDRDAIADATRRMLGLDVAAVHKLAAEFEARAEEQRERMDGIEVTLDDGSTANPGQLLARIRDGVEAQRRTPNQIQHAGQLFALPTTEPRSKKASGPIPDALPDGERAKLAALGYLVRYSPTFEEYEVRHKPRPTKDDPKPADAREAARRKLGNAMAMGFDTERHAWAWAHAYAISQLSTDGLDEQFTRALTEQHEAVAS